ncbi:class IIb bacteriocin, lactobin A/cerein 7B family [Hymenobacter metallicola]|uniref:Class IIb bacteriocin, lactobin A/cerein 7B family n=1 Tax=Hymenobacter metallicola TaxID=2563114 RepID=A0A4Z0QHF4_9BACT|nr:class IIb bacteriocin, lactobin A/cerein 7B family [Hymenobacter metallicola]
MNSNYTFAPATESMFESRTIVELSELEMMQIDGGTTPVCAAAVASSNWCIAGGVLLAGVVVGYFAEAN